MDHIDLIIQAQKGFYSTGAPQKIITRLSHLKRLKLAIKENEQLIFEALNKDLGKSGFEAYVTEVGLVYQELTHHIKKLKKWAAPKRVESPLYTFPARSFILKEPYGQVLIIGSFNFPFQLVMMPLIGAISAGNTVVVKPSDRTPETFKILEKIISGVFEGKYVKIVEGDIETGKLLLQKNWGFIFFTGSTKVGEVVAQAAAKTLTPVILELGGKNPAIIDKDANLKVASRKIVWGKFINAGQSCIAPDYILVHHKVEEQFIKLLQKDITKFYSEKPAEYSSFPKIINKEAIERLQNLAKEGEVVIGGMGNKEERFFAPTILKGIGKNSEAMQEEIFGPILPITTFSHIDEAISSVNSKDKPLVLYYFSENRKKQKKVVLETSSGDVCINEVMLHFVNNKLPFGGVGKSGIGNYHGKYSFDAFSHSRSVLKSSSLIDFPARYPPHKNVYFRLLRFLMR